MTVTLSFWVYSSLTGTFGGSLRNNGNTRSYPFTYTISSANTWTQASVTIAGDTSGTWLTTNGIGILVTFSIGTGATLSGTAGAWAAADYRSATGATSVVGTNGATFYITGVQLEKGSTATSFDYRPYGTELTLCQRYYYQLTSTGTSDVFGSAGATSTTGLQIYVPLPVEMRVSPTSLVQTGTAADYTFSAAGTATNFSAVPTLATASSTRMGIAIGTVASGLTAGQSGIGRVNATGKYLGWSAEL